MTTNTESDENDKLDFLRKVVLAEVSGKNAAIHAYDEMIWKIRTGFLTLLFVGWSVLLKSITDSPQRPAESYQSIVSAMFLFSLGLALGAWFVDHTYVRRKFRVILALNDLMTALSEAPVSMNSPRPKLLQVSGDNPSIRHRCEGFWEAMRDSSCVFFLPILTLAVAAYIMLPSKSANPTQSPPPTSSITKSNP